MVEAMVVGMAMAMAMVMVVAMVMAATNGPEQREDGVITPMQLAAD